MPGQRYPNLFIAGVPKAATTTWYVALGRHPDVFMPEEKELRFLDRDLTFDNRVETEEDYLAYFEDAGDVARRGDASPWYFYSREAPKAIRRRVDDPRVLVLLRDPVERLYSLHGQMVMSGAETIEDFGEALDAQEDRKKGRRLPDFFEPREGLYYWDIAHYAPHARRYLDIFEDDELMFVRFEEFTGDPEETYRRICRFLDVDPGVLPEIPSSNSHQVLRSERIRDILKNPPGPIGKLGARLPGEWGRRVRDALWQLNLKKTRRDPMPADVRRRLTEHCREDVEELEGLLGWDLSPWKRLPGEAPSQH